MTDLKILHKAGLNGDAATTKEITQQALEAVAAARNGLSFWFPRVRTFSSP